MSIQLHGERYRVEYTRYLAAYDLTYPHHYEMQDDWLAVLADPDLREYTSFTLAKLRKNHPWIDTQPLSFEFFEQAMLCVADDEYWAATSQGINFEGTFTSTWICRWRRRLGRPVLAGVDDNPRINSLVWRDNWRVVRDEVAALNVKDYPTDHHEDRYIYEDAYEYLNRGYSFSAAIAELADRLVREAGWPEESRETRQNQPGEWGFATLAVASKIAEHARSWREYIETKSGKPLGICGKEMYYFEPRAAHSVSRSKKLAKR